MSSFFDSVLQFFNGLYDTFGLIGQILLAPISALTYLLKWVTSVFEFIPKFLEYCNWAIDVLPSPLDDIGFFLLMFILSTLFVGVIKFIVR